MASKYHKLEVFNSLCIKDMVFVKKKIHAILLFSLKYFSVGHSKKINSGGVLNYIIFWFEIDIKRIIFF